MKKYILIAASILFIPLFLHLTNYKLIYIILNCQNEGPRITAVDQNRDPVSHNGYSNKFVRVTVQDYKIKNIRFDGKQMDWSKNDQFSAPGVYVVTAKDSKGKQTVFSFIIDQTLPLVFLQTEDGKLLKNGESTTSSVKVNYFDEFFYDINATRDNTMQSWPKDQTFINKGKYTITATDLANNKKEIQFEIK